MSSVVNQLVSRRPLKPRHQHLPTAWHDQVSIPKMWISPRRKLFYFRLVAYSGALLLLVELFTLTILSSEREANPEASNLDMQAQYLSGGRESSDYDNAVDAVQQEFRSLVNRLNVTMVDTEFFNYMTDFLHDAPYPGVEKYTQYAVARSQLLPLIKIEPLKPDYGQVINDVTSFGYPLTIPRCRDVIFNHKNMFIAVISAPGNFEKRAAVRSTWRKHLEHTQQDGLMGEAGFGFFLGQTEDNSIQMRIEEESLKYGDIVQIQMADSYRNLSTKVAALLNWVWRYCDDADFILKVDDDIYVNVQNLATFIQSYRPTQRKIFGSATTSSVDRKGKWGITFEEWPWKSYPEYFAGGTIVMTKSAIVPLLAACQTVPMMPFDDVYLTGILAAKARAEICFTPRLLIHVNYPAVPDACFVRKTVSWLTSGSSYHMNSSHGITEQFYKKEIACDEHVEATVDVAAYEYCHY